MPFPPGYVFASRYRLARFIGRGGYGEVYEAVDTHQGDVVAIKLLQSVSAARPWAEAEVLTALRSRYILGVRNADVATGTLYLVTDLACFGTAADRMSTQGVHPDVAVGWIRHACRGTTRTHHARLVHRDIKPDNLFLTAEDAAVLGDFGLAKLVDAAGRASWGGTPITMAPEVVARGPTSVQSDVYSLGASMYALLAGRYAHNGPDPASCYAAVLAGPPPRLRDIAPHVTLALAARVETAMERDQTKRYPDPACFDAALGELPTATRRWRRTDEHAPHHRACFRGESVGSGRDATVCAVASGRRFAVEACHQPTGRAINAASRPPARPSLLARNLRAAMATVS